MSSALRGVLEPSLAEWERQAAKAGITSACRADLRAALPAIAEEAARLLEGRQVESQPEVAHVGTARLDGLLQGQAMFINTELDELARAMGRALSPQEYQAARSALEAAARRYTVSLIETRERRLRLACETQGRCLAFLSHDLRGNLNGVVLMTEVLRRELSQHPQFAESTHDLGLIRSSVMETVEAMERMVHAERLARGKVSPRIAPTTLDAVAREVSDAVQKMADEKTVEVRFDLPATPVRTDLSLVAMAVRNLVENALRHAQGPITVSARPWKDRRGWMIAVRDGGTGIEANRLRELVEGYGGTDAQGRSKRGLGLLIARHVAELLGGRLTAESSAEGSVFWFAFPDAG